MEYARFTEKAERDFQALPNILRRLVGERVNAIARQPDPQRSDDWRLIAKGNANSGLILSGVKHGPNLVLILYRIRKDRNEVWVQAIRRVYQG